MKALKGAKKIAAFVVFIVVVGLLLFFLYTYFMIYLPQRNMALENYYKYLYSSGAMQEGYTPPPATSQSYWDWLKKQLGGPGKPSPVNTVR